MTRRTFWQWLVGREPAPPAIPPPPPFAPLVPSPRFATPQLEKAPAMITAAAQPRSKRSLMLSRRLRARR